MPSCRSSWLALVDPSPRARKYHHHCAAAKMPRAQSGRKRLAVYARQLALEPRLQILRRSRRPLLQRLEQARRSALAHHVHRTAPMGAPVLINGSWYKAVLRAYGMIPRLPFRDAVAASPIPVDGPRVLFAVYHPAARPNNRTLGQMRADWNRIATHLKNSLPLLQRRGNG